MTVHKFQTFSSLLQSVEITAVFAELTVVVMMTLKCRRSLLTTAVRLFFVKCWVCKQEDTIAFDFKPKACTCNRSDSLAGDGSSPRQTRISCVSEIRLGDHIAWHQRMGYWHHAIVTEINGTEIRVLHYNGPNLPNKGTYTDDTGDMIDCIVVLR